MFQMMGVFAEFEREMIRERVNAGLARARANGTRLGRPPKANPKSTAVLEAKAEGLSIRAIASRHGLSVGTVHKIVKSGTA